MKIWLTSGRKGQPANERQSGQENECSDPDPETIAECSSGRYSIFNDVEINNMYSEHKLSINQLADIYPLSRLDKKRPAGSRGLNQDEARSSGGAADLTRPWSTVCYRLRLFGAQFLNTFRLLLLFAAGICALIFVLDRSRSDEFVMTLILAGALVSMCWLSYVERGKAMKHIRGFRAMMPIECTVVREGRELRISANHLVRGDLLRISAGDRLPADVRLIDAQNLRVEASWILGIIEPLEYVHEPAPPGVGVLNAQNIAFGGSSCTSGSGIGVVIRVGNKSLIGRLMELIAKEKQSRSCLETEHNRFVSFITVVSLAMSTVTFLVGLYLSAFHHVTYLFVNGFLIVLVANVPQGLPVTITAQLLIVARRLHKKCGGMWLKRIDAADTFGITSALVADRTGVLTEGAPRVTDLWLAGRFVSADHLTGLKEIRPLDVGQLADSSGNFDLKLNTKKEAGQGNQPNAIKDADSMVDSWVMCEMLNVMAVCNTAYIADNFSVFVKVDTQRRKSVGDGDRLNAINYNTENKLTTRSLGVWPTGPSGGAASFRRRQRRRHAGRSRSVCLTEAADKARSKLFSKSGTFSENEDKKKGLTVNNQKHVLKVPSLAINNKYLPTDYDPRMEATKINVKHSLFHADLGDGSNGSFRGRPIDTALLQYAGKLANVAAIRRRYEIAHEIPFSPCYRYHLAIVAEHPTLDKDCSDAGEQLIKYKVLVKGAPEELIRNCSTIVTIDGTAQPLTDDRLYEFEEAFAKLCDEAKTCLAFAFIEFDAFADALFYSPVGPTGTPPSTAALFSRYPESGWCFLGMTALQDAPRAGAADALRAANRAGVRTIIVTGDHPASAEALARRLGFVEEPATKEVVRLEPPYAPFFSSSETVTKQDTSCVSSGYPSVNNIDSANISNSSSDRTPAGGSSCWDGTNWPLAGGFGSYLAVVHGDALSRLSADEIDALLRRRHAIFARVTPPQKLQLVKYCQRLNYTVAFATDGLMDSMALKQADIGIASNSNGSVFAKEAADIVIANSNISNLIRGVEEARLLYDNLKKTVAYTLSHLLPELLPVLLSFISGLPLGLNSLQVLIIDLLTEIPPSVALIYEPPERDIMRQAPRRRAARLVTPQLLFYAYAQAGPLISAGCALAYFTVFWQHGLDLAALAGTSGQYWLVGAPPLYIATVGGTEEDLLALNGTTSNRNGTVGRMRIIDTAEQMEIRAQANAAWHVTLVIAQVFHSFICATRRTSFFRHGVKNWRLVAAVVFQLIFMAVLVFVPSLQSLCGVRPPPAVVWAYPVALGLVLLVYNEARKFFIRRYPHNRIVKLFKW